MRSIIYSIAATVILGCSSYKKLTARHKDNLSALESILRKSNGGIYHRTIIQENQKPISLYVESYNFELNLCVPDADPASVYISDREFAFLKKEFSNQTVVKLDRLYPELRNKMIKKHQRFKTVSISMPVVFRNGSMAMYYATGTYGGEFGLLQNKQGKWERICSSIVWDRIKPTAPLPDTHPGKHKF